MILIPIAHEKTTVRSMPWVSIAIFAICVGVFLLLLPYEDRGLAVQQNREAVLEHFIQHPYLELDPRILPEDMVMQWTEGLEAPVGAPVLVLQEELDQRTERWLDSLEEDPTWRWGMIVSDPRPVTAITHMFLHGGWLHLLFNMLFLYLTGPFVEDAWGKLTFAFFYLGSGALSAVFFSFHYPDLFIPSIGASGAIAAVMGAFLIQYGKVDIIFFYWVFIFVGRFAAPAWLMLPLWFLGELISARMVDFATGGMGAGGTAYWVHVWGFAIGVTTGLGLRRLRPDLKPKPAVGTPEVDVKAGEVLLNHALHAERESRFQDAWTYMLQGLQKSPDDPRLWEALVELVERCRWWEPARPVFSKRLRKLLGEGATEAAFELWRKLAHAPVLPVDVMAAVKLAEAADTVHDATKDERLRLMKAAVLALAPDTPPGAVHRVLRLTAAEPRLYWPAVERALANPLLDAETRERLEQLESRPSARGG